MSCAPLAVTGVPVVVMVTAAGALLVAGGVLLRLSRTRCRGTGSALIGVLLIGGLLPAIVAPTTAHAATPLCDGSPPSSASSPTPSASLAAPSLLTIVQTSTVSGLGPGIAATVITGTITNHAMTTTVVAAVTVSIAAVTKASLAATGSCDASDYVLLDPVMTVGQSLAPGGSASFAGAEIGFSDKPVNQDACQNAVISLNYLSS